MKKILNFIAFLVLIFCLLVWIKRLRSVKSSGIENDSDNIEASEKMESISKDHDDYINSDVELKKFYDDINKYCDNNGKKLDNFIKTVDNYVQRYISLFLITSNLLDRQVKDLNEEIVVDLELSITGQDLIYLQGYSKNLKDSSYIRNFSKLDDILSKIARAKEKSYMEEALRSSQSFFARFNIIFSVLSNPSFQPVFSFLIIFIGIWTFVCFFQKHIFLLIGIISNSAILWEGLILYWKKVRDVDTEIYVNTNLKGMPEDCNPANKRWYQGFLNVFYADKCLQYYKDLRKNPTEEVSLFSCIIDTYSYYFIKMPVKIYGASITDITGHISELWPWPFNYLANIPLAFILLITSLSFILILCGKRLKLSFFGGAFEVGDVKVNTEKIAFTNYEMPNSSRVIRKLKPWTKSRFPKRSEENLWKRRKLLLKASKSALQGLAADKSEIVVSHEDPQEQ